MRFFKNSYFHPFSCILLDYSKNPEEILNSHVFCYMLPNNKVL